MASCVAPQMSIQQIRAQESIPTCDTDAECEIMWNAAQVFVVQNSYFKMQTVSDAIIQTYGPTTAAGFAFTVMKEPTGNGQHRVLVEAYCGNIFGCGENPWSVVLRFNDYVNPDQG